MNSAKLSRLVCFILLLASLPARAVEQDHFANGDAIKTYLRETFGDGNTGMVIGLVDGKGTRIFGAGKLDNGTDQEVDGDTLFEIGSATKVFTSLLALDMERRGEWDMDDPVAKHLPERVRMPSYESIPITLRNLASQDSGLPWHPDSMEDAFRIQPRQAALAELRKRGDAFSAEDLYAFLSGHTLTNAPGKAFQYSNVGMALLGHVTELKAGKPYEPLVLERICRPLKMNDTGWISSLTSEQRARLARGHWADGTPSENVRFKVMAPAGGLISTANDLLKFVSANIGLTETPLRAQMDAMQIVRHTGAPRFGTTGMPWVDEGVYQPVGSRLMAHGGGGFGYLAFAGFDAVKRRGVVVLSNQLAVNSSGVGWTILQGMPLNQQNVAVVVREIVGLGVALALDEKTGRVRITSVYAKSPAGLAGVSAGLLIQKINDASVEGKTIQECLAMMGGKPGAKVRLELHDPEKEETKAVELVRGKFLTASN